MCSGAASAALIKARQTAAAARDVVNVKPGDSDAVVFGKGIIAESPIVAPMGAGLVEAGKVSNKRKEQEAEELRIKQSSYTRDGTQENVTQRIMRGSDADVERRALIRSSSNELLAMKKAAAEVTTTNFKKDSSESPGERKARYAEEYARNLRIILEGGNPKDPASKQEEEKGWADFLTRKTEVERVKEVLKARDEAIGIKTK